MLEPDDPERAGPSESDATLGETVARDAHVAGFVAAQPPLPDGYRLGRYEIRALLGAGGMGRVYRALDPALGREVAIKALAEAFHNDSASLKRFEREARVLATLSHPNIASIYGFELLQGAPYLILERIEGETLADALLRGPLELREALGIALQVAEGLSEAHAKGVIHRDLKPSNVMLAADGRVKLVDFGLAKTAATERGDDLDPTTVAGAILGTAPYMSPEQIHATSVDTRTDVWAFGCVLYEMLAGRRAFPGRSAPEILAAVLRDEPDWSGLPAEAPAALRRLLQGCLQKDPRDRLPHIGDARRELAAIDLSPRGPGALRRGARRLRPALPWLVAATASLGLALALSTGRGRPAPSRALRLSLELPPGLRLGGSFSAPFAVAPGGSPLALEASASGSSQLYLRNLDDLGLRLLPDSEGATQPFFSPDGRWVAFFAQRKLVKVPVGGGPGLPLCEAGSNPRGGAWASGGTIVFAPSQTSGLVRVPDAGGKPETLTSLDSARGESSHRWPEVLPGGRWVVFTSALEDGSYDEARLEAVSLETGERRTLLEGAGFSRYLPDGQLAFVRAGRVYAVAFDAARVQVQGRPREVLAGVRYDPRNGGTHLAVSATGTLLYAPAAPTSLEHYLAFLQRDGTLTRLVGAPRAFRDPRMAPDGVRVAVVIGGAAASDLWLLDANATLSQLSFGLSPHRPAWTVDGSGLTVGAQEKGAWRLVTLPADGAGPPRTLHEGRGRMYPDAWSPDGRRLVFQELSDETGWDLHVLDVDAAGQPHGAPRPLAATPSHESNASLSPDGRWVAYESDELDALVQVYVRSFPDGGHKTCVSSGGARWPVFGRDGQLYYWDTSTHSLHAVRLREQAGMPLLERSAPLWQAGQQPKALARVVVRTAGARFDLHPSGERFLVLEAGASAGEPTLALPVVVPDWTAELQQPR